MNVNTMPMCFCLRFSSVDGFPSRVVYQTLLFEHYSGKFAVHELHFLFMKVMMKSFFKDVETGQKEMSDGFIFLQNGHMELISCLLRFLVLSVQNKSLTASLILWEICSF